MKTINLLDNTDFVQRLSATQNIKAFDLKIEFTQILRQKLEIARKESSLIYTQDLRGIGKTYELIHLAKQYNYCVVEPTDKIAEILRDKYDFQNIYHASDMRLRKMQVVLVDEGVDIEKLVKEMECRIITGYSIEKISDNKTNTKEQLSFTEQSVNILKDEIRMLEKAMTNSLKNADYSGYKNLIVGYKETMRLIQDMDWKLMYSEYAIKDDNDNWIGQVSIWEQNGDGNIKNHKIFKLADVPEKSKEIIREYYE